MALWGTIIVVAAALGAFWVYQSSQSAAEREQVPASEFEQIIPGDEDIQTDSRVIEMTDSGFLPEDVTIGAGETITFINNGQAAHWPASDVHPTHEILPEFDSRAGLATGEEYSYTFAEPGVWHFHDHLFPQFPGTVTVQ